MRFADFRNRFLERTASVSDDDWDRWDDHPMFHRAPRLSAHHVDECVVLPNRDAGLSLLESSARVAEVGTQYGRFAELILQETEPSNLVLFDISFDLFDATLGEHPALKAGLERGDVELVLGDSAETLSNYPDEYFDWIYIDGDHRYAGVCRDARVAKDKVKRDGVLIFNDYTHWSPIEIESYGVPRAVNELCIHDGWKLKYLALDANLGYQDVALVRIDAS